MSLIHLDADENWMDERIDKFLSAQLQEQSRSYLQKIIKEKAQLQKLYISL